MLIVVISFTTGVIFGFVVLAIFGSTRRSTPEVPEQFEDFMEATGPLVELSEVMGWPKQWMICPACSQQSWVIPPHLFSPCPLLEDAAGSMGLKIDAERMTAVRAGNAMERQFEVLSKLFEDRLEDEEDE
jgi:hypothetical protein